MHDLYRLKENLVKELEELGKQDLSKSSLETVDKLAHAAKNVAKVIECCEEESYSNAMGGGYSRAYSRGYSRGMSYADGDSYEKDPRQDFVRPDGSYRDGGMSYARGRRNAPRDSMGRYSGSEGVSVDEQTKQELMKLIEKM